jgi:hypothetical protein
MGLPSGTGVHDKRPCPSIVARCGTVPQLCVCWTGRGHGPAIVTIAHSRPPRWPGLPAWSMRRVRVRWRLHCASKPGRPGRRGLPGQVQAATPRRLLPQQPDVYCVAPGDWAEGRRPLRGLSGTHFIGALIPSSSSSSSSSFLIASDDAPGEPRMTCRHHGTLAFSALHQSSGSGGSMQRSTSFRSHSAAELERVIAGRQQAQSGAQGRWQDFASAPSSR